MLNIEYWLVRPQVRTSGFCAEAGCTESESAEKGCVLEELLYTRLRGDR